MNIQINQMYRVKAVEDPFAEKYYVKIEDLRTDQKDELWVKYSFSRMNDDGTFGRGGGTTSTLRATHFLEMYELYSGETKSTVPDTAIKQLEVKDEER